jgi:hypothetical protein
MILQTSKYYCWCTYHYFRYEITKGYRLPLSSCWNNFIKLLKKFVIATIVNVWYSLLGWGLWCNLVNGWRYIVGSFYTIGLTVIWRWSLFSTHYVASMFGAFINSFIIGFICYSSYICVGFIACWCIT